jgi:putative membrane protein
MNALLIAGLAFIGLAAAVHVYFFYLESIAWSKPATWRLFGLRSQDAADTVRPMALNQGFYNLFLALGAAVGIVLTVAGVTQAGVTVALFAALSMVGAATVLVLSNPRMARAAAIQGAAPLVGTVLVGTALVVLGVS